MKNYFIVGASSGIGKALTHILHEEGHKVYGTYLNNHLQDNGAVYRKLNVLEEGIEPGFLPEQLHGLVYCPGSINLKPFARITRIHQSFYFRLLLCSRVIIFIPK